MSYLENKLNQISKKEIDYKLDIDHIIYLLNWGEINVHLKRCIEEFINNTLVKLATIVSNYVYLNKFRAKQEEKDSILNNWIMITKRINVMNQILDELPYEYTEDNESNVNLIRWYRIVYNPYITNL